MNPSASPPDDVLARLELVARSRGVVPLADHLGELRAFIESELSEVERELQAVDRHDTPLHNSAHHLLRLGGKRLRPMCVALAARVGSGFSPVARDLAVAVELVHNATLLHDDVIDLGDRRRGTATARLIYGNCASIYAGDWLLVEALDRIYKTGLHDVFASMLDLLKEMLFAESLQLANRGKMNGTVADYFRVVEGKTASLFRWGLYAGGRAGNVDEDHCRALGTYGQHLGVAFQVIDDMLDLTGDPEVVGKSVFADLREGKITYPLLRAMDNDPSLARAMEAACHDGMVEPDTALETHVANALRFTDALDECFSFAKHLSARAIESLASVPSGRAKDALEGIAVATLYRSK